MDTLSIEHGLLYGFWYKSDKVALMGQPLHNTFDEAKIQMINRCEELTNLAESSRKEAERAIQQCEKLEKELEELNRKIEEQKMENEILRESDQKSKKEIENLKEKAEASVKVVNLYGQLSEQRINIFF